MNGLMTLDKGPGERGWGGRGRVEEGEVRGREVGRGWREPRRGRTSVMNE